MISVEHSNAGTFPEIHRAPAAAAIDAGVGVALSGGKLVVATADTNVALLGVTLEAATEADQVIMYEMATPDMILKVTKTGTATPALGTKYDLAADGKSINADDTTNPKVKVIEALAPAPGSSTVTEWLAVNTSFAL